MDDYISGLEDMFLIIKAMCALSREERTKIFGASRLDIIMDRFNFIQFYEVTKAHKVETPASE